MFAWQGLAFLLFIVLGIVNLVALKNDNEKLNKFTKPLLMPLLAVSYWLTLRGSADFEIYLVVGLLCGFLGDVFLLGKSDRLFTCGLLAFLVGHIFYILLFWGHIEIAANPLLWIILPLVLYALCLLWVVKKLFPSLKKTDKPGVCAYMVVILAMSYFALQFAIAGNGWLPFAGSLLFVASDTMLAFQNFKFRSTPFSRVAVMLTYLLAQSFIMIGFIG